VHAFECRHLLNGSAATIFLNFQMLTTFVWGNTAISFRRFSEYQEGPVNPICRNRCNRLQRRMILEDIIRWTSPPRVWWSHCVCSPNRRQNLHPIVTSSAKNLRSDVLNFDESAVQNASARSREMK
jgi:hypothetical protein